MVAPIKYRVLFALHKHDRELDPQLQCRVKWGSSRFIVTMNTGYRVNPERWNSQMQCCLSGSFHGARRIPAATINGEIARYRQAADDVFTDFAREGAFPSVPDVRAALTARLTYQSDKGPQIDVFRAFDQFTLEQGAKNSWSDATHTKWRVFRRHLQAWRPQLAWADFDEAGLTSFVSHLRDERGFKNTSLQKAMAFMRWFLGWSEQKGYLTSTDYQTYRPKFKGAARKEALVFLTWDELMALWNWVPDSPFRGQVRDIFCFCCFTSLRYSDAVNLRWPDVGPESFRITMVKTAETVEIQLNEWSSELLGRYVDEAFPDDRVFPPISNQVMNRYIHEICKDCGIDSPVHRTWYRGNERHDEVKAKYELVTTHCGRRTFICNALAMGISPTVVMQWTGHSDYSAMQPYIGVSQETKAAAMAVFEKGTKKTE